MKSNVKSTELKLNFINSVHGFKGENYNTVKI